MKCQKVQVNLTEYLRGRCAPRLARAIEQHLHRCKACQNMLEEERALLQLLREEPAALPPRAWEQVQARLHEPARARERVSLWLWWNRRLVAQSRWAAAAALIVLAVWTWMPRYNTPPQQETVNLSGYVQVVSYAQSTVVDDPLNENTQIILSGWGH